MYPLAQRSSRFGMAVHVLAEYALQRVDGADVDDAPQHGAVLDRSIVSDPRVRFGKAPQHDPSAGRGGALHSRKQARAVGRRGAIEDVGQRKSHKSRGRAAFQIGSRIVGDQLQLVRGLWSQRWLVVAL